MKKKKQYNVVPQKFEEEPEYNDVKPGDQGGDNDIDRITATDEGAKKKTDESYIKQQTGKGTEPSPGANKI